MERPPPRSRFGSHNLQKRRRLVADDSCLSSCSLLLATIRDGRRRLRPKPRLRRPGHQPADIPRVLPTWSKVGRGCGGPSGPVRVNPSALFTNSNFVQSTRTHDDRIRERALAAGRQTSMESGREAWSYDPRASSCDPRASSPAAGVILRPAGVVRLPGVLRRPCRQASMTRRRRARTASRRPRGAATGPPPGAPPARDAPARPPAPPGARRRPSRPAFRGRWSCHGPREPAGRPVSCWGLSRLYDAGSVHDASYVDGVDGHRVAAARPGAPRALAAQFGVAIPRTLVCRRRAVTPLVQARRRQRRRRPRRRRHPARRPSPRRRRRWRPSRRRGLHVGDAARAPPRGLPPAAAERRPSAATPQPGGARDQLYKPETTSTGIGEESADGNP